MRITVVGAGGVGGTFGARLAQAGAEVGFVARGAHHAALRERGLALQSPLGDVTLHPVRSASTPAELGVPDLVLVCVKLWDLEAAVDELRPAMGPGTAVLSLQNGVGKDDVLERAFGRAAVLGGVAYLSARVTAPGVVRQNGTLQKLVFGELDGGASERTAALLELARRAGVDAAIAADVRRAEWEKFVFLVGLSAATASMRSSLGPIRAEPRARAFLLDVMREVVAVGRARGVALDADYAEQRLAFLDTLPETMEASMYADLQEGGRLELDWLSGAVERMGRESGVDVPMNRAAAAVLAPHAGGRRAPAAAVPALSARSGS